MCHQAEQQMALSGVVVLFIEMEVVLHGIMSMMKNSIKFLCRCKSQKFASNEKRGKRDARFHVVKIMMV